MERMVFGNSSLLTVLLNLISELNVKSYKTYSQVCLKVTFTHYSEKFFKDPLHV